ncbi:MAG: FRG domain-containing protein [Firmicutes bacterium]|nr:FRG domain-containing protein [Bacillota bacterium]
MSITTVHIDSLEGISELLFEAVNADENGRYRTAYYYRGMPNVDYSLVTSLARNYQHSDSKKLNAQRQKTAKALEMHILENFTKYASIEDPSISESIWKAMIVGQHHGLPTRLLDWTHSPLVALHFSEACDDFNDFEKNDAVVWRIDVRALNKKLPEKYQKKLNGNKTHMFSVKTLSEVVKTIQEYDKDMGNSAFVTVEPPSIDERIVNQYAFFTLVPNGIKDLAAFLDGLNDVETKKYIIDKSIRWQLREYLDQFNMSERTIYPGLDGIAKWLARHYYVK